MAPAPPPGQPRPITKEPGAIRKMPGGIQKSAPPQKRSADDVPLDNSGAPPPKRLANGAPTITKAPGGSGLLMKASLESPPPVQGGIKKAKAPGSMMKRQGMSPKATMLGAHTKSSGMTPPPSPGAAGQLSDPANGGAQETIKAMLMFIKQAPGNAKLQNLTMLADGLVRGLQIDHLNILLNVMKKKLVLRAQREGVQPPSSTTPQQPANEATPPPRPATPPPRPATPPPRPATPPPATPAPRSATPPPRPATPPPRQATPPPANPNPPVVKKAAAPAPANSNPPVVKKAAAPAPANSNPPVVKKAAIAKAPIVKQASAPKAVTPASVPTPSPQDSPDTNYDPSPPSSPPPDGVDLNTHDPLYVLVGSLLDNPVCLGGDMLEERLDDILQKLWGGVAKKPKCWIAAWQAMLIPVDRQADALMKIVKLGLESPEDPAKAPGIIADLAKAHKVKMKSVEDMLVTLGQDGEGLLAGNDDAWHLFAFFLMHIFPKPALIGWGWSRVGWSWQSWWQFAVKSVAGFDASRATDVLIMVLRLIQDKEGAPLADLWTDGDKLEKAITRLVELAALGDRLEVIDRLSQEGIVVPT